MCNNHLCEQNVLCNMLSEKKYCSEKKRFYNFMKYVMKLKKAKDELKEFEKLVHTSGY